MPSSPCRQRPPTPNPDAISPLCGVSNCSLTGKSVMKRTMIALAAFALTLGPIVSAPPAEAKGCLKGAMVGGVAGHYAGHHGVLGAIGGCVVGRHLANEKEKQNAAGAAGEPGPAPAAPGQKPD